VGTSDQVIEFHLFSTPGCHLCEEAEHLLSALGGSVTWHAMDIAEDDDLTARYGTRIPALRRLSDGGELNWPFDLPALHRFIHST
jgi:hypothetical protein